MEHKDKKSFSVSRFTVLPQEKPASIVAQYGPFRVSQTAPATPAKSKANVKGEPTSVVASQPKVDVSAHLVTKEVISHL